MDHLRGAFGNVVGAIEAEDPERAFTLASELVDALKSFGREAAVMRARMTARIAEERGLTVRGLAIHLNISKSQAHKLLQIAKRADGK